MQKPRMARLQFPVSPTAETHPLEQISKNLMEALVLEEIERQLSQTSPKQQKLYSKPSLLAFALNRLPGLYATSKRGRSIQEEQARAHLGPKIEQVVRQAFAAVTNDPLRSSVDNWASSDETELQRIMIELQDLLQYPQLNPENLIGVVKERILQSARGEFLLDNLQSLDWEKHPLHQRSCS